MSQQVVRARVVISGRVQGVFFRASTRDEAASRRLSGWVRNLPGHQVEAVFEGPEKEVREVLAWCHEGPPFAAVRSVEVEWQPPTGEFDAFHIRY
jgi:acylphosphatase